MRSISTITLFFVLFISYFTLTSQSNGGSGSVGSVTFVSYAPNETIEAKSKDLKGAVDWKTSRFAFAVSIQSFMGFNSRLQREHFNENYMESSKFPKATFSGKIIETVNTSTLKTQQVRAKGKLTIHGVSKEVTIPVKLTKSGTKVLANSQFKVKLADYSISIPRIVSKKLSDNIDVEVNCELKG